MDVTSISPNAHFTNAILDHVNVSTSRCFDWQEFVHCFGRDEEITSDHWMEEKLWKSLSPSTFSRKFEAISMSYRHFRRVPFLLCGSLSIGWFKGTRILVVPWRTTSRHSVFESFLVKMSLWPAFASMPSLMLLVKTASCLTLYIVYLMGLHRHRLQHFSICAIIRLQCCCHHSSKPPSASLRCTRSSSMAC